MSSSSAALVDFARNPQAARKPPACQSKAARPAVEVDIDHNGRMLQRYWELGYTAISHALIDWWMAEMSGTEFKVAVLFLRKTIGDRDKRASADLRLGMTLAEMQTRTGADREAVVRAVKKWTLQQLREALPGDERYKFLLHDRHKTFSADLDEEVESWGLKVLKSPPQAPTANAFCERLIGTIRRECLDYVIPLNESHLKRTLREWPTHYNTTRPHQSLGPGIPDQAGQRLPPADDHKPKPVNSRVIAKPILNGLHHEYRWADAA
jgi:hypothetical protein